MARIKIKDLPKKSKISTEEMKKVLGGTISRSPLQIPIRFSIQGISKEVQPDTTATIVTYGSEF